MKEILFGILILFVIIFIIILVAQQIHLRSFFSGRSGGSSIYEQGFRRPSAFGNYFGSDFLGKQEFLSSSSGSPSPFGPNSSSPFLSQPFSSLNSFFLVAPSSGFSSFAGKITVSPANVTADDPQQEYITISYKGSGEPVSLAGWSVQQKSGARYFILPATRLPANPATDQYEPIVLKPGDRVILGTGFSPRGQTFQLNKCIGYFNENYTFFPSLPGYCALPDKSSIWNFFTDACLTFIQSLPGCRLEVNHIKEYPLNIQFDQACVNWITDHYSYAACLRDHKFDPDFYIGEWRSWLQQKSQIWSNVADTITLRDSQERIVDQVSY